MADTIFTLNFKPGILRDNTPYQGEYCTDGQWVRFYNGKPQSIGGMQALPLVNKTIPYLDLFVTTFHIETFDLTNYLFLTTDYGAIYYTKINNLTLERFFNLSKQIPLTVRPTSLWKIIPIVNIVNNEPIKELLFFNSNDLDNITNNNKASTFKVESNDPTQNGKEASNIMFYLDGSTTVEVSDITINKLVSKYVISPPDKNASSGALFVNPYLFVYGNNGYVEWSAPGKPFTFTETNKVRDRFINISTDKVIFAANIRGGQYTPSLLFWTLSSVIKLTNKADVNSTELDFNVDIITKNSSILSSRCVVEHNGIFYWLGTDSALVYNGIVTKLPNDMNMQYFFENIDMKKRQYVYATKIAKYNEIWWFYPEIKNQNNDKIGCTRALIYNIVEKCWYDTAIERSSAFYDETTGQLYTYGRKLSGIDKNQAFWQHEIGRNEVDENKKEQVIESYFTTPTISLLSYTPIQQTIDRLINLKVVEPDFKMGKEGILTMTVNTKEHPQSTNIISKDYVFTGITEKIDTRIQGRLISFTFKNNQLNNYYRMGNNLITISIGDGR